MDDLEKEYKALLEAAFSELRMKFMEREIPKDMAEQLHGLLEERLGMEDPNGELPEAPWAKSSWCVND